MKERRGLEEKYLRSRFSVEVEAAGLLICRSRPGSVEAALLHRLVAAELDDHEVGGAGEGGRLHVLQAAGESRDVDGGLLGPPSSQDLHGVENLLRVELGELQEFAIKNQSKAKRACAITFPHVTCPIFRWLACLKRGRI